MKPLSYHLQARYIDLYGAQQLGLVIQAGYPLTRIGPHDINLHESAHLYFGLTKNQPGKNPLNRWSCRVSPRNPLRPAKRGHF